MNEIIAQCFVFFNAGFETSSSVMSFCLYELAVRPNIQEKVRKEILTVMEKYNNDLNYDSLKDLTFLEQTLQGIYSILQYLHNTKFLKF